MRNPCLRKQVEAVTIHPHIMWSRLQLNYSFSSAFIQSWIPPKLRHYVKRDNHVKHNGGIMALWLSACCSLCWDCRQVIVKTEANFQFVFGAPWSLHAYADPWRHPAIACLVSHWVTTFTVLIFTFHVFLKKKTLVTPRVFNWFLKHPQQYSCSLWQLQVPTNPSAFLCLLLRYCFWHMNGNSCNLMWGVKRQMEILWPP